MKKKRTKEKSTEEQAKNILKEIRRLFLEKIVKNLAACKEPLEMETGQCLLCGSCAYSEYRDTLCDHKLDCPWGLARQIMEKL